MSVAEHEREPDSSMNVSSWAVRRELLRRRLQRSRQRAKERPCSDEEGARRLAECWEREGKL